MGMNNGSFSPVFTYLPLTSCSATPAPPRLTATFIFLVPSFRCQDGSVLSDGIYPLMTDNGEIVAENSNVSDKGNSLLDSFDGTL